ncbi:hypothetical protein BDY24DRAFT_441995 [Mrakia frigida]|uniref:uncharacterized protein n=1 Tax=Mrakia frigida TaxID=29902 RepID=UPI003FCC2178
MYDFEKDACRRVLTLIEKYQKKFHESDVYRVAILLHPSLDQQYFKAMDYTEEFIQEIARDFWIKHYKKDGGGAPLAPTSSGDSMSSILGSGSRLERARAAARSNDPKPQDAFWLWMDRATELVEFLDELCPVGYWGTERRDGGIETESPLWRWISLLFQVTTGVDVEQAFSVSSHLMSKRRHRLNNSTAAAACTLGRWSNAGLVPDGLLTSVLRKGRASLVIDLVYDGTA